MTSLKSIHDIWSNQWLISFLSLSFRSFFLVVVLALSVRFCCVASSSVTTTIRVQRTEIKNICMFNYTARSLGWWRLCNLFFLSVVYNTYITLYASHIYVWVCVCAWNYFNVVVYTIQYTITHIFCWWYIK